MLFVVFVVQKKRVSEFADRDGFRNRSRHASRKSMARLPFVKMHGIGNDYVYVDCFAHRVADPAALARRVSPRRTAIGSDGLILICPSEVADCRMEMYNADGSRGEMCGNGIRCVGKYVADQGLSTANPLRVETDAGDVKEQMPVEIAGVDPARLSGGGNGHGAYRIEWDLQIAREAVAGSSRNDGERDAGSGDAGGGAVHRTIAAPDHDHAHLVGDERRQDHREPPRDCFLEARADPGGNCKPLRPVG